MSQQIHLPSELYIGTTKSESSRYTKVSVFIIPVEKGSKRYETINKNTTSQRVIDCKPIRGLSVIQVSNTITNPGVIIQIPELGTIEITLQNFCKLIIELENLKLLFSEAMMVYDGKTLQITERKEIIYSNYRFQGIKIKEKKVSIFRNENDIYTISPLFHHLEQMKEGTKLKIDRDYGIFIKAEVYPTKFSIITLLTEKGVKSFDIDGLIGNRIMGVKLEGSHNPYIDYFKRISNEELRELKIKYNII